jgi:hypothetical protein
MKLKEFITATLSARENKLEDRHLEFAAKIGVLPELLDATVLAENNQFDWPNIWEAYKKAGHACPDFTHVWKNDQIVESNIVCGYDQIDAFGVFMAKAWVASYGGSNPSWNGISYEDWVVEKNEGDSEWNYCLHAMAQTFNIKLNCGRPPEPDRSECVRDYYPQIDIFVIYNNGDMKEMGIYRCSHPKEDLFDERIKWSEKDSPFPHYYVIAGVEMEFDSVKQAIAYIQKMDNVHSVYNNEVLAEKVQLSILAKLAVEKHGEPKHFGLREYVDDVPYLIPLSSNGSEEDRYHPDLTQWRNIIDVGWIAILSDLEDAWGKRAVFLALKRRRKEAQSILAARPHTVWVSLASSYAAGNCRYGTKEFLRKHGIDPEKVGAMRADVLLSMDQNNIFLKKACELAALGVH